LPQNKQVNISVVSPVYKALDSIDELISRLLVSLGDITDSFEIILVDDCSPDNSWDKIVTWQTKDKRVRGLKLSRNFGQHNAIAAGLDFSRGKWVVVMDCDLQDQPEEISRLYQKALEGFEIVFGARTFRHDAFLKRATSRLFFRLLSYLTGWALDGATSNFGIFNRRVIDIVCSMEERLKWIPGLIFWVGFRRTSIPVKHARRSNGRTSYSYRRLVAFAIDVICMSSDRPLRLSVQGGLGIAMIAFAFGVFIFVRAALGLTSPALGWASIFVSIWFLCGLIIFNIGIIGLYLSRVFNEVKRRPIYIVDTTAGLDQLME
jgi:polyisoprenyl-phosphate glycosyltransferase